MNGSDAYLPDQVWSIPEALHSVGRCILKLREEPHQVALVEDDPLSTMFVFDDGYLLVECRDVFTERTHGFLVSLPELCRVQRM